ncbi:hypothetical protein L3Y34_005382 [Caenorhabditis briggsae]|uniref:HMG box domain-containing protein n=1 Tax=Caenorhabditis briggsae TaxID=6238 RepID=A0AAE9D666_CAEBR|nr:hypothetical protein L3Y34_005382 [Caenorhabditis briggsae]
MTDQNPMDPMNKDQVQYPVQNLPIPVDLFRGGELGPNLYHTLFLMNFQRNMLLANLTPNLLGFPPLIPGFLPLPILATPLLIQNPPVEDMVAPDDLANVVHQNPSVEDVPNVKQASRSPEDEEHQRIKKPLNAFMYFAKEHRPKLWAELGTSSAEIIKILGKKWQELSVEEREKYVDIAQKEREEHKVKYPGWKATRNYRSEPRKRMIEKRKPVKKCRARFGMENEHLWCIKCLQKKRCSYQESIDNNADDKMGIQNQKPKILNTLIQKSVN